MKRVALAAITASLLIAAPVAAVSTWTIDPAHTKAQFAIRHMMVSTVRGTLGKVTGVITIDTENIPNSTVEATIDATAIDTHEPKRDTHLKSPDFFDTAKYPTITFKSTAVEKLVNDEFQVTGNLTMHGVTKQVILFVQGTPDGINDPFGNVRLGGVVNAKINRQDFGIMWNKTLDSGGTLVGNEVAVTIDVELIKQTKPAAGGAAGGF